MNTNVKNPAGATVTPIKSAAELALADAFRAAEGVLPGNAEVLRLRQEAFDLVAREGLPHRRVESWKYTDLRTLMRSVAPLAAEPDAKQREAAVQITTGLPLPGAAVFSFVNGYATELPSLGGIEVVRLRDALANGHPLIASHLAQVFPVPDDRAVALNAAFMADGLIVRVPAGISLEQSIHLDFRYVGEAAATHPRVLVVVEPGASLKLVESHVGPAGIEHQSNAVVEIAVGDEANVEHVRLNRLGDKALSLSTLAVSLGRSANFETLSMTTDTAISRHQVYLRFAGEEATAALRGTAMLRGRQHADSTLFVDHAVPGGTSRELFKHVIDDEATGVFQGKIVVRPHAQKTDGRMMSSTLLLGEAATMNNKPELEIFADDVQCGHGATVGSLDDDMLFYLMARGLPRQEAEALLVQAFVAEAVEEGVSDEALRDDLIGTIGVWLLERADRSTT